MFFKKLIIIDLKLSRHVIFNIYKYISQSLQTLHALYILIFFSNSISFWWISVVYLNFCATLLWLLMRHILKAIWKSRQYQYQHLIIHLSISIDTAKLSFSLTNFFWKNKTFTNDTAFVLNYLAIVSVCYNYSFLYDLFFIHPEASIGVLEKRLFELL